MASKIGAMPGMMRIKAGAAGGVQRRKGSEASGIDGKIIGFSMLNGTWIL
jgi:hypothetical protein